jgi:NAD(P)-dependent dehydrogenase (short-subunit alcohol dehydrogenase family)
MATSNSTPIYTTLTDVTQTKASTRSGEYPAAARLMSDWTAAIAAAVARSGGLDILVNNGGLFLGKGVEEASLDE